MPCVQLSVRLHAGMHAPVLLITMLIFCPCVHAPVFWTLCPAFLCVIMCMVWHTVHVLVCNHAAGRRLAWHGNDPMILAAIPKQTC